MRGRANFTPTRKADPQKPNHQQTEGSQFAGLHRVRDRRAGPGVLPRMSELRYREALNVALREELRRDERVVLLGEDIGVFGGAFELLS